MAPSMRHPRSKYIHARGAGGRFRRGTLADIGMAHCERCEAIFVPKLPERTSGPVDPFEFNLARRTCTNCGHVNN